MLPLSHFIHDFMPSANVDICFQSYGANFKETCVLFILGFSREGLSSVKRPEAGDVPFLERQHIVRS